MTGRFQMAWRSVGFVLWCLCKLLARTRQVLLLYTYRLHLVKAENDFSCYASQSSVRTRAVSWLAYGAETVV